MEVISPPERIIQQHISQAVLYSRRRKAETRTPAPFLFTVNRKELGAWQRSMLEGTRVDIRTLCQVVEIRPGKVVLKTGEAFGFRYLVGADGYASVVRRYLGLKVKKRLIGFQYTLPVKEVNPVMEMFLDARRFSAWYAWIFPHRNSISVGCCCDPERVDHEQVKTSFLAWLKEKEIDPGMAKLESCPIACDYQGYSFGNIYLGGEAAGLASGFTGEGIYQSLASGKDVARLIMDPDHKPDLLNQVLKYNRALDRLLTLFWLAGPLRGILQELLVILITRKRMRDRINAMFS